MKLRYLFRCPVCKTDYQSDLPADLLAACRTKDCVGKPELVRP